MKKYLVLLLLFVISGIMLAHRESPLKIIVDTDMGLDDVRALALLLQSDHVDIQAIIATEGAASIKQGSDYINKMLNYFDKKHIPIYEGHELKESAPFWREKVQSLNWEKYQSDSNLKISSIYKFKFPKALNESYVYVALGPLTNLDILTRLNIVSRDKIASVYFAGYHQLSEDNWQHTSSLINKFNIDFDSAAAYRFFNTQIPIYCFSLQEEQLPVFTCDLVFNNKGYSTSAAEFLREIYDKESIKEHLCGRHPYYAYDEIIALYLDEPYIGSFKMFMGDYNTYKLLDWNREESIMLFNEILSGEEANIRERETVVLSDYLYDPEFFKDDVKNLVDSIISKHGKEEWKAVLLTNELHRHLGIYSILGAKMGIRAREVLHANLDEVTVESFAGLEPPLSCLNDGLQVSTGASLGRGNISVVLNETSPKANFIKSDKMLEMNIKPELVLRIKADVKAAGQKYGFQSKEYFDEIRRLSFNYWLNLDRNDIFEEYIRKIDKGE